MFSVAVTWKDNDPYEEFYIANGDHAAFDLWWALKDHVHKLRILTLDGWEIDPTLGLPLRNPSDKGTSSRT